MSSFELLIETDVRVPMRDGVLLATDIYRPIQDHERLPALVLRTPYDKSNRGGWGSLLLDVDDAMVRGYAVVAQDARGCHASQGRFRPITQERDDGYDTIAWVASQPWCNGKVGIWGSSYMGATALQAAVGAPDALKAAIAYLTAGDYYRSWAYVGGAFELGFNIRWAVAQAAAQLRRKEHGLDQATIDGVLSEADRLAHDPEAFLSSSLDVRELAPVSCSLIGHITDWIDHPNYDSYWRDIDVVAAAERVTVPILTIAGWHDGFLGSMLPLFEDLRRRGPEAVRTQHKLIVGPWDHQAYLSSIGTSTAGTRNFGPRATGGRAGLRQTALDWFDVWLKDDVPPRSTPAVRFFQMGEDQWMEADTWPVPSREVRWYLWSAGHANTSSGDGALVNDLPGKLPPDSYRYDPLNPAPTVGGRILLYPHIAGGLQDQHGLEARPDVLVYTSALLVEDVRVCGPVRLELYVRTSAPTTDFTATLVDLDDNGIGLSIADGIVRLSEEHGPAQQVRKAVVDLWQTAYTFPAGHQLRVHVTSSSFPRFDRNRNVASSAAPSEQAAAIQQILHDQRHPSALVLSVADPDHSRRQ